MARVTFRKRNAVSFLIALLLCFIAFRHLQAPGTNFMPLNLNTGKEERAQQPRFLISSVKGHSSNLSSNTSTSLHDPLPSKAIVIARTSSEAVDWVNETLPVRTMPAGMAPRAVAEEWDLYIYTTDDLAPALHTPVNKGHEAMVYLTYIIEHYAVLPEVTVFLHAHRSSWHDNAFNMDVLQMLSRLNLERVAERGFLNLRCAWEPGCPDHIHPRETEHDAAKPETAAFATAWRELFPLDEAPEKLSTPCCAQFAITAERLRLLPLARYVLLRDWILNTELEDAISGRIFEYIYHYIWTGQAVLCPEEHECYCQNYGICFGGKHQYEEYHAKRREWLQFKLQVQEFADDSSNPFTMAQIARAFRWWKFKASLFLGADTEKNKDNEGETPQHPENFQDSGDDHQETAAHEDLTRHHDWPKVSEMVAKIEELADWLDPRLLQAQNGRKHDTQS